MARRVDDHIGTLTRFLDELTDRNTPIFHWSDMDGITKIMENNVNSDLFILNYLKNKMQKLHVPYGILRVIVISEIILKKLNHSKAFDELSLIQIMDVLIHTVKTTNRDNIRRKILLLFRTWSHQRYYVLAEKLNKEDFRFFDGDKIQIKNVPSEFCYNCENRSSYVICAICIQLFCNMCSLKSRKLPEFGFSEEVRVCDDCFNPKVNDQETSSRSRTLLQAGEDIANAALLKSMECPICLDIMKKPIIICNSGHSMCHVCTVGKVENCPICRGKITSARNYAVENLLENQKIYCVNNTRGCQTLVKLQDKESHETGCKFRLIECEGRKFSNWKCDWNGSCHEILQHFSKYHKPMLLAYDSTGKSSKNYLNEKKNSYILRLINFKDGENFFWYKQRIDIKKRKIYWIVQLIGSKEQAAKYCYEIMIFDGPGRHFKVREICVGDTVDVEEIFESEKCVVLPLRKVKTYANSRNKFNSSLNILKIDDIFD